MMFEICVVTEAGKGDCVEEGIEECCRFLRLEMKMTQSDAAAVMTAAWLSDIDIQHPITLFIRQTDDVGGAQARRDNRIESLDEFRPASWIYDWIPTYDTTDDL